MAITCFNVTYYPGNFLEELKKIRGMPETNA
jgi:hypothetical protein